MKRALKCFICCLLSIAMISLPAFAEEEHPMSMSWEADYENEQLVITFESTAPYIQQVTAVMYPHVENPPVGYPEITDYVRIAEKTSYPGTVTTITFTIDSDLVADKYDVVLKGNGYLDWACTDEDVVKILTPSAAADLVEDINGANKNKGDSNYIGGYIEPKAEELGITIPGVEATKDNIMSTLVDIRDNEYGTEFKDLNEVRDAYNKSRIIVSLHEITVNNSENRENFKNLVEANATLLKFDITEEDYNNNKDYIYDKIISNKTSYDGGKGIRSATALVDAIKKYRAIKMINGGTLSPTNTLHGIMVKYHNDLGVSADSWSKYTGFESDDKRATVLRQLYNKGFTDPSVAKTAFENGVTTVYNAGGGTDGGTDGGAGNGGDSGFGMGNESGSLSQKPDVVPVVKGFFDCGETHWAYTYVKDLYDLGFISGYADGSFLPDNSVTREEFVKMVIGATGLYNENAGCNFSDVPADSWSYKYVASAYENGIVTGNTAADFGAKSYITREDVCVISARILAKYGKQVDGKNSFTDADSISDYAKDGVDALVELGIINGFEDGSFGAKKLLTRAQAAKIISLLRASI